MLVAFATFPLVSFAYTINVKFKLSSTAVLYGHVSLVIKLELNTPLPISFISPLIRTFPLKLPFLHGLSTTDLNALIGFGLILMIPDFIKMVKGWVGVKESGLNLGIGSFFAGAGIFTSATGAVGQIESLKTGIMGRDPMERQKGIIDFINPLSRKSKRTGGKS